MKHEQMTSEDVSRWVEENGEDDAGELLAERFPTARKDFDEIVRKLNSLLKKVSKDFPEARYYLASGTLCLMLGANHEDGLRSGAHQERVGYSRIVPGMDGGDW